MLKGLHLVNAIEPGPFDWSKVVDESYLPPDLRAKFTERCMGVAAMGPHASLRGVTRIYPAVEDHSAVHALGPVDLDLRLGEFFSVVGPSGCGEVYSS